MEGVFNMNKNELLTAIFNLYLYAESAVQFVTPQEMDKMITEIYDAEVLTRIIKFIDEEVDGEGLEEFIKQESIKQYFLNLEKVVNHLSTKKDGDD